MKKSARHLFDDWAAGLTNRSRADDRSRLKVHVLPRFGSMPIEKITHQAITAWLDDLRVSSEIGPSTQTKCLHIVSRFFEWAILKGLVSSNPARLVRPDRKPRDSAGRVAGPWIRSDEEVQRLVNTLHEPIGLMFYVGNRSGLRLGEICGLRLSDLAGLEERQIRVRFSYANGNGKNERSAPAPADAAAVLGPWLEHRRAAGAGPEAFVFARADGRHLRKEFVEHHWERGRGDLGSITWRQATEDSFVLRNLSRGCTIVEVAGALDIRASALEARFPDAALPPRRFPPLMVAQWDGSTA